MAAGSEHRILEAQMGRTLDGTSRVVSRCALGLPVVIEVDPDMDGKPFPTLYYLTCPLARIRVSRLESQGWIKRLRERLQNEPELAAAFSAANAAYVQRRAELLPADSPVAERLQGGIAGAQPDGVKCLHAHYAHHRAGGPNPIGTAILDRVEPLDCTQPCVVDGAKNTLWREPARDS